MRRFLIVACGIALALLSGVVLVSVRAARAQENASPQPLAHEIVPCPMGTPIGEIEGETIVCGQIQVPENWAEPEGNTLTISYARLVAKATVPFEDPVIYFEGGPGGTALGTLLLYLEPYQRLREDRDVILWDQRGTRYSSQLYCPDDVRIEDPGTYQEAMMEFVTSIIAMGDPTLADDAETHLARERSILEFDNVVACRTYFEEQGIDITQYSTANTVLDTIALMHALGDPAFNFHAISYGTTVALAVMQHYTDHAGSASHAEAGLPTIRSVVLDGVYPLAYDFAQEGFIYPYNILRPFVTCEADPDCAALYPDIQQRLIDLLNKLDAEPIPMADGDELTGRMLGDFLIAPIVRFNSTIPWLPRVVDELERGETATFDLIMRAILEEKTFNPPPPPTERVPELGIGVPELTDIAANLRDTAMQIEVLGLQASIIRDARETTDDPVELYLILLDRYIKTMGTTLGTNLKNIIEGYVTSPEEQTRAGLLALNAYVGLTAVQRQMNVLVEGMSDDEVAQVFGDLISREFFGGLTGLHEPFLRIVNCNDRAANINTEYALELYREYPAPQLMVSLNAVSSMEAYCEALGLAADEYAPPPPGVVSDIPTLVVNGALDLATPVESGEQVMETLTNAQMITFPRLQHGATILSDCSVDLTYNFIMYPEGKLNLSCLEESQRPFAAPDAPLPELYDPS